MPHYLVKTHLACWQLWLVEAASDAEAKAKYADGEVVADDVQAEPVRIEVEKLVPDQPDLFAE
jgi:hypothetical protein